MVGVLADTEFRRGLQARDREGQPVAIQWNSEAGRPVWRVAQHHSQSNVTDQTFQTIHPGIQL